MQFAPGPQTTEALVPTGIFVVAVELRQDNFMPTLEEYLKENIKRMAIDHALRATVDPDTGKISFYIRPQGVGGPTLNFEVYGNALIPL